MSNPKYVKLEDSVPAAQNLPLYEEPDALKPPAGPAPLEGCGAPPQYQPYYSPPGAGFNQGPVLQPPQSIVITRLHPTNEPHHLAYSIFTMLCCCLPLGIAALVFSVQTQEANRVGNSVAARRSSRMALILAHTALGVGLSFLILYIVFLVISFQQTTYLPPNEP